MPFQRAFGRLAATRRASPIRLGWFIGARGRTMADDQDEPLSPEEAAALEARREARAAIPAVYIDTWATLTWKGHIRFVLGEWVGEQPHYRAAFLMELEDAKRFARQLLRRVEDRQKKDKAAGEDAQDPEGES